MGKNIIQQARGHGSLSYRVRRQAFRYRLKYPSHLEGEGVVLKLINSLAHFAPLAKIRYANGIFYMPAFKGMLEGQKINFGNKMQLEVIKSAEFFKIYSLILPFFTLKSPFT